MQIIEENRKPTTVERFNQAFGRAAQTAGQFGNAIGQKKQLAQGFKNIESAYANPDLSEQQKLIQAYSALPSNPDLAQTLGGQLSQLGQKNISNTANAVEDQQRYDVIKNNFGERAAELYKAAPEGGKTNFLNTLLESRQRGLEVEDLLGPQQGQMDQQNPTTIPHGQEPSKKEDNGSEKPSIKAIDFDKGLLPKERVRRQEERYSKNLPLYQESQKKSQGLEAEKDALNILQDLSPKIGAIQRLNINPSTGELLIPGLASPEAQRFVKTVNDFTVKAKDSYGARVSNFELDRFMKRLPTLANSEEGRAQIIRQMQIINDINSARERALQDVFDEYGGIRNIDYDKAESLADKHARPQIESLRKEFRSIDSSLDKQYNQKIQEKKKRLVPPDRVLIEKDGKNYSYPKSGVKKKLKEGYKLL